MCYFLLKEILFKIKIKLEQKTNEVHILPFFKKGGGHPVNPPGVGG